MNDSATTELTHEHVFGQDQVRAGEGRTKLVILITAIMMVVEIAAGWVFGSMALLADGLHMASHAAALSITVLAYVYARRHAHDRRFSFGTGKVNALGGFAGALLLVMFALLMVGESVHRLLQPVPIAFSQAIIVAVVGLLVNGVSVLILGGHGPDHSAAVDHQPDQPQHPGHHHDHDHNLRSAYLHVLADALTSVLAIVALVMGKYFGWNFMDPLMGLVGAALVTRWAVGLLRDTSRVLLDHQAPPSLVDRVREALEQDPTIQVTDLHVWSIGPGIYAASITLTGSAALNATDYRRRLSADLPIVHCHIEVHPRSP